MEELKLITYLSKWPVLGDLIFPREHERHINLTEFQEKIRFEDIEENKLTEEFFYKYLDLIHQRSQGRQTNKFLYLWGARIPKYSAPPSFPPHLEKFSHTHPTKIGINESRF